ncbi:VOC family protein [Candidatus Mycobacterium methanotrophicum]|uniref:VOC family protein n=1 Tax=Candidatus Mycobacterium methanotrophicum TaxID=2943498 RepID=A0ABY4QIZ4_9MYCO|nr:VOC family protein [Candidatus Mycobacterium methanotrophicum]UQX10992.1 VOC family protein [Candidatus Mycobacterium methanotrophicum]
MDRYINRLFHVCITVPDIDEALAFYQDVLGLESIGSLRNERSDGAVLGFPGREIVIHANHLRGKHTDNATVIDLIEFVEPATVVGEGPYGQMNHVGITRMAFDVDDTDAIYDTLRRRGDVELLCEPATVQAPTDGFLRILTFKDPHGIVLELIEHRHHPDHRD